MDGNDIIAKVKSLNLPKGSYVVFGSCPMALAEIRKSNDIDLLVDKETLAQLKQAGWKKVKKSGKNDEPYVYDVFEAHSRWIFSSYQPTLEQLLETATYKNDVPFASLEEVKKWKLSSGRPKDLTDIELINTYFNR